ncbi:hypothetical protein B0H13DRAFT_1882725 [Mycena leptocephala]|nr:hypothetical protein B0H13DRAFT_1882725 [Mycena leptocephala]
MHRNCNPKPTVSVQKKVQPQGTYRQGTLWNYDDVNKCKQYSNGLFGGICGGDLADLNSMGQPQTQRLETQQNLSRGPTCRSPVVVPMKEVKGNRLQMSGGSSADDRRTICRSSADRISA